MAQLTLATTYYKGYTQKDWINYNEFFPFSMQSTLIQLHLAIVVSLDLKLHHTDVKIQSQIRFKQRKHE